MSNIKTKKNKFIENKIKGLTVEDMIVVDNIIELQKNTHIQCGFPDLTNITLYIIGKEIEGIEYIKVFNRNTIAVEILDTSYTRMRSLATLEDWNTKFILCVVFNELGEAQISKCKISDIPVIEYKKAKELIYGVSNGIEATKINIMSQDIKGLDYRTLKEIVGYTYNKNTGNKEDIDSLACILLKHL